MIKTRPRRYIVAAETANLIQWGVSPPPAYVAGLSRAVVAHVEVFPTSNLVWRIAVYDHHKREWYLASPPEKFRVIGWHRLDCLTSRLGAEVELMGVAA